MNFYAYKQEGKKLPNAERSVYNISFQAAVSICVCMYTYRFTDTLCVCVRACVHTTYMCVSFHLHARQRKMNTKRVIDQAIR